MLYKISLLLFIIFFCFCTHSEPKTSPFPITTAESAPTDLLPPSATKEHMNTIEIDSTRPDLTTQVQELEKRVDRLENLIEILRSSSSVNKLSHIQSVKEDLKETSTEKDPVIEFERIKQLAISKDSTIESAVRSFKESYKDNPLVAKAHFFLADYYYSQKEYEKATNLIKEGLVKYKNSPEEPRAIWILSLILLDMEKQNEACIALKKMLSLPQKSVSADLRENATRQYQLLNCQ